MSADTHTHTHQLMSYELVYTSIHSSIIYTIDNLRRVTVIMPSDVGIGAAEFRDRLASVACTIITIRSSKLKQMRYYDRMQL